jgi:hypothetical protein
MKQLLILFLFSLLSVVSYAQNNSDKNDTQNANPSVLSKATKTTEIQASTSNSSNAQALILEKYLGINSFDHPEMKSRKQRLFNENPEAYKKMVEELGSVQKNSKQILKRAEYESFPADKKRYIDTNSEKYIIVE